MVYLHVSFCWTGTPVAPPDPGSMSRSSPAGLAPTRQRHRRLPEPRQPCQGTARDPKAKRGDMRMQAPSARERGEGGADTGHGTHHLPLPSCL